MGDSDGSLLLRKLSYCGYKLRSCVDNYYVLIKDGRTYLYDVINEAFAVGSISDRDDSLEGLV